MFSVSMAASFGLGRGGGLEQPVRLARLAGIGVQAAAKPLSPCRVRDRASADVLNGIARIHDNVEPGFGWHGIGARAFVKRGHGLSFRRDYGDRGIVRAGGIADLISMNASLADAVAFGMGAVCPQQVRDMGAAVCGFELWFIDKVEGELRFHWRVPLAVSTRIICHGIARGARPIMFRA